MCTRSTSVLAVVVPDWIPEKGRRDGVKGLPFGRRSPAATASTGTLIFDLGRSLLSAHVYSIPTECLFLLWTSLVARRSSLLRVIMDSSPSTPYFLLRIFPLSLSPLPFHIENRMKRKLGV